MATLNLGTPNFGNNSTSYTMSFSGYSGGKWVLTGATYDTDTGILRVVLTYNRVGYNSQGIYASLNNDRTSMGNSSNYTSVASGWGTAVGIGENYAVRKTNTTTVMINSGDTSNIAYLKTEGGASSGSGVTGITMAVSSVVDTDAIIAGTVPFYLQAIYGSGWKAINNARWIGTEGGYSQKYSTTLKFPNNTSTFSYTITYNANGGSGAPAAQTKDHGSSITLSSTKPTRTGYTFKNWNTEQDGSGTSYSAGSSYATDEDVTLYAQWTINTYTVSYNANGGSGAPTAQTKTYGVSLTLSNTKPTRTGYTFQGWGTSASDTTTDYAPGASYTANSAITLYAIWNINTYQITYNANGGTGAPSAQTKTYGVNLTLSSTKPTRSNTTASGYKITFNANDGVCTTASLTATNTTSYTFKAWNTVSGGTGTEYDPGESYKENAAATLYAQWNATTTKGNITLPTPTRDGYTFMGWAESATATFGSKGTYTPTGTKTLYAIWSLIPRIPLLKTRYNNQFVTNALIRIKVNGKWVIVTDLKLKANNDF